jgi:hypothetical protein
MTARKFHAEANLRACGRYFGVQLCVPAPRVFSTIQRAVWVFAAAESPGQVQIDVTQKVY